MMQIIQHSVLSATQTFAFCVGFSLRPKELLCTPSTGSSLFTPCRLLAVTPLTFLLCCALLGKGGFAAADLLAMALN